ncbi:MAG: tetratricopeptide repeat protein [Syntrophobacteraceae bacterium]
MRESKRVPLLWMAVLLLATSCASTGQNPEAKYSADQLLSISEKFLAASDVAQALKYLSLAERKRPKDPQIQYYLGLAYEVRGLPEEALKHYQNAIAIKPDYAEVYNNLGSFYAAKDDLTKAEENYRKALAIPTYETPFFGFFNLGRLAEKRGDMEGALKEYDQAIRLLPNYGAAYYRRGLVLENLRRPDEAKETFSQAVLYSPDQADAHLRFGILCYAAGEIENSLYSFSKVLRLAPHSPAAAEAKRYLERMQGIMIADDSSGSAPLSGDRLLQVEVVSDRDSLERAQTSSAASAARSSSLSSKETLAKAQRNLKAAGMGVEIKDTARGMGVEGSAKYIVQVGSFLEKENAEKLRKKLASEGYDALVRPFSHQSLGKIFVVQLKPVEDATRANTLMAEVEKLAQIKPIVIKVPVNP